MLSQEFIVALTEAQHLAAQSPDSAVAYMAQQVPTYAQERPTPEQARAGGCPTCTYLGLWASSWPGYTPSAHGTIWIFEEGVRRQGGNLVDAAYRTILHEMDHALQRDHVLERLGQRALALPCPDRPCLEAALRRW